MEEHYIKDVGKITYVYGVNLEEHKTVIEKQQKRLNEQAKQIEELNQRLVSKDKYIDELENDLNWERGNKLTIHKQFADRNCYVTLEDYKADIAEKDKEIENLKQQLEETNAGYNFTYEQSTEAIKELKQNQTQLAIQELEKVKTWCDGIIRSNFDMTGSNKDKNLEVLSMKLDQQINDLRGEKDEKL